MAWLSRLRNLSKKDALGQHLEEELRSHIEMRASDSVAGGMSPKDARYYAQKRFGNATLMKERTRDMDLLTWLESVGQDIRFGVRSLRKSPGFAAVAILTLALGIGANTAIFSLFDAILLESLPVREPARLALFSEDTSERTITGNPVTGEWGSYSYENYKYFAQQQLPFESLCAFRSGEDQVTARMQGDKDDGQIRRATAHLVTGNYFDVMGVRAAFGRLLSPEDDLPNSPPVAVVSFGYWQRAAALHADPAAVGKVAILNGTAFTIVGVAPQEFFGERVRRPPDYWLPLTLQPRVGQTPYLDRTDAYWLRLLGRLRPGATRVQAQTAATIALQQFLTQQAGSKLTDDRKRAISNSYVHLYDGAAGISSLRFQYSKPLQVLLAVVALVLLIACANVGSLLLSRSSYRRAEITVRLAMGAGRMRLARQLLTESLLLAALGGLCGVLLARWAIQFLTAMVAPGSPVQPHLNSTVLAFTIAATALAGILFGLVPAIQGGSTDIVSALKAGGSRGVMGRRRFGATQGMVIGQIALSLILLVGAGLFSRSLLNLERVPLGFDQENVLLGRVNARLAGYKAADAGLLYRKLYDRMNSIPGVTAATIAYFSPLSGSLSTDEISVEGYAPRPGEKLHVSNIHVAPSYSEALGIPLVAGREIGLQDVGNSATVAMINESFARHYFTGQNPIGHRFGAGGPSNVGDIEIIGVLKDASFESAKEKPKEMFFLPLLQAGQKTPLQVEIELRTSRDPASLVSAFRQAVTQVDSRLALTGVQSLHQQVESTFDQERLAARLISFFGGLALLLACVGLYGVVAQGVARRTNEFGVRMALGAQRKDIVRVVLRETSFLLVVGLLIGVPAAIGSSRLIATQLYGIKTYDFSSFALAIVILGAVSALAGFLPARRASRVDPIVALRYE
jgi:predicted permease